jgi:single-stranded-DNA-specific exonuclease
MQEICTSSLSQKRWALRASDDMHVQTFIQKLGVSPTLARLLVMRGHDLDSASLFLKPSLKHHLPEPLILKDMDKAVTRLQQAIQSKEKIVIWGDYDVDGATSSALLSRFFKSIQVPTAVYIPDRIKEGYGPNALGIQKFINQGYTVMITVDCGTTSFEAFESVQGMDVIVLDHHAPEAGLPSVTALVNPNRLDEKPEVTQTLGHLAAVGISFLYVVALNRALREQGFYQHQKEPDLLSLLDLVALGTVCDVMPLTGLNRTFVSQGLKVLALRKNIGLRALADMAGLDQAPTPYHLGFALGPRINAGGRIGESFLGTRLLSNDNPEEAFQIAKQLDLYNQERRSLETDAIEQAYLQADPSAPAIVVAREGWHEGIIGIVAGRLKEKFHKPSVVIAWDKTGCGKGSARSIPGFDFGRFIHKAHHLGHVLGGGGHAMAAGFSLNRDQLQDFTTFLLSELSQLEKEIDLRPLMLCDGYLDFRSLTPDLLNEIENMSPFGMGNPNPKFIFSDVMVESYQLIQEQHIKCRFTQGDGVVIEGIGFRFHPTPLGEVLMDKSRRPLDLLASPKLDTWGGKTKINLMIEDASLASSQLRKVG